MLFWILSSALAMAVAAMLVLPLLRGRGARVADKRDMDIYRAQLGEIDRDLARGVLGPDEAERSVTEIGRRLLAADRAAGTDLSDAPAGVSRAVALVAAVLVVGGGLGLYAMIGAPGYGDLPLQARLAQGEAAREGRMSQAEAEMRVATQTDPADTQPGIDPEYAAMVAQLREMVPTRPDDLTGWELLSRHEAALGNYGAAARAQERVIVLKGAAATPADLTALVDRMVAAAQGFVSPEAEELLTRVLAAEPRNIAARYYIGLLYAQTDRPDIAFRLWRAVIDEGAPELPYVRLARLQIEEAAFLAGIDYSLPPEPGPSADDMAAAADMTSEDRDAMIRGMVAQLSDRLASEGGPASDWARLIGAYGVLGETEAATAIWAEAQQVFGAIPADLATIREAAERAGVAQ